MLPCLSRSLARRLLLFPLLRSHRFICFAPLSPCFPPSLLSPRPRRCDVTMLLPTMLLAFSPGYLRLLLARCCTSHPLASNSACLATSLPLSRLGTSLLPSLSFTIPRTWPYHLSPPAPPRSPRRRRPWACSDDAGGRGCGLVEPHTPREGSHGT